MKCDHLLVVIIIVLSIYLIFRCDKKSSYTTWRGIESPPEATDTRPKIGTKKWWSDFGTYILRGDQSTDPSTVSNLPECRGFAESNDINSMEEMIKNPWGDSVVMGVAGVQALQCSYEPLMNYIQGKKNHTDTFDANSIISIQSCPYQGYGSNWFGNLNKPGFYPAGKIEKDGTIKCELSKAFTFKPNSVDAGYLCPTTKSGGTYYPNTQKVECDG